MNAMGKGVRVPPSHILASAVSISASASVLITFLPIPGHRLQVAMKK
jgi:hypothetical protein